MRHSIALDLVIGHLIGQNTDPLRLRAAQYHIAGCRSCLAELDAALALLNASPTDLAARTGQLLTCDECRDYLPEYAEQAQQLPQMAAARLPAVARHLRTCALCRAELGLLLEVMRSDPTPNVLPAQAALPGGNARPLWQTLGGSLRRLYDAIPVFLAAGRAQFNWQSGGTLRPLAPAMRGGETSVPILNLDDPESALHIELRLTTGGQIAARLETQFAFGADGAPPPARLIMTTRDNAHVLGRVPLQPGGEARLPLRSGKLALRVEFGSGIWEIWMDIEEAASPAADEQEAKS